MQHPKLLSSDAIPTQILLRHDGHQSWRPYPADPANHAAENALPQQMLHYLPTWFSPDCSAVFLVCIELGQKSAAGLDLRMLPGDTGCATPGDWSTSLPKRLRNAERHCALPANGHQCHPTRCPETDDHITDSIGVRPCSTGAKIVVLSYTKDIEPYPSQLEFSPKSFPQASGMRGGRL